MGAAGFPQFVDRGLPNTARIKSGNLTPSTQSPAATDVRGRICPNLDRRRWRRPRALAAIATLDLDELKLTFERIGRPARAFAKLELGATSSWSAPSEPGTPALVPTGPTSMSIRTSRSLGDRGPRRRPALGGQRPGRSPLRCHPHVTGPEQVRFYAGAPIRLSDGQPIGVVRGQRRTAPLRRRTSSLS